MLLGKLQEDMKTAMMARDEIKLSTVRFLLADIKNYQIEKQRELTDEEVISVIERQVKRHRESIEGFEKGGRRELAEKEKKELSILQTYLPAQVSEEEVRKAVDDAIESTGAATIAEMGKVMGALSGLHGKADFSLVSQLVKEKLS
ncbi:MAG TPA: GatB/YqeY domain-containing protein [Candidatus Nanoarchaeia archaeon]|nr:putative protein YqeY [uncultured archaeon]